MDFLGSIVGELGFNGTTFVFSIVNFLIVFTILYKFVFGRIAKVLDKRQKKIKKSLEDAERVKLELSMAEKKADQIIEEARKEKNQILQKAHEESEKIKEEKEKATREAIEEMEKKSREKMAKERNQMIDELREDVAELALMATEKIVKSKLDKKVDKEFIIEYLDKIEKEEFNG